MESSIIMFCISSDIHKKFQDKIKAENLDAEAVIERLISDYLNSPAEPKEDNPYHGKANKAIPLWAMKPNQNNHKVIRAYFKALQENGEPVRLNDMLHYCTNAEYRDTYIPPTYKNNSEQRFRNTYNQLKIDTSNSNGKVFEDNDTYDKTAGRVITEVTIWDTVKDTLMEFKKFFGG